jgi:hypothetical protein
MSTRSAETGLLNASFPNPSHWFRLHWQVILLRCRIRVSQSLAPTCRPLPKLLFIIALLLTLVLGVGHSQTLPSDSRETVLQEVKAYAARHVQADAPMQTDAVIRAFSDNRAGPDQQ